MCWYLDSDRHWTRPGTCSLPRHSSSNLFIINEEYFFRYLQNFNLRGKSDLNPCMPCLLQNRGKLMQSIHHNHILCLLKNVLLFLSLNNNGWQVYMNMNTVKFQKSKYLNLNVACHIIGCCFNN